MSITLETSLSRDCDILYAPVGAEEAVMLSISAGRYYGLNAAATRIWELIATPMTISEICEQLCEEFEVDAQSCESAVLKFVNEMVSYGMVHAA